MFGTFFSIIFSFERIEAAIIGRAVFFEPLTDISPESFLLPSIIYNYIIGIVISIVSILMLKKYFERRARPTLYLSLAYLSISIAVLTNTIGLTLELLSQLIPDMALFFVPYTPADSDLPIDLATTLFAISNIFLLYFISNIFSNAKLFAKFGNKFNILFVIITLIFCIVRMWTGISIFIMKVEIVQVTPTITAYANQWRILLFIILVIISLMVYSILIQSAISEAGRIDKKLHRRGFYLIAVSGILDISTWVFFIVDTIIFGITGIAITIYNYLAWTCAIIASFSAYLGYLLPNFLRKRWSD